MMVMDVITCTLVLASANDLNQVGAMSGLMMTVAGSQRVLASLSTETVCPAYSGDFGLQ